MPSKHNPTAISSDSNTILFAQAYSDLGMDIQNLTNQPTATDQHERHCRRRKRFRRPWENADLNLNLNLSLPRMG